MYAADGAAVRCSDCRPPRTFLFPQPVRTSLAWSPAAAAGSRVPPRRPLVQEVLGRCRFARALDPSDLREGLQSFVEEPVVLSDALMKLLGQHRKWTVVVGCRPWVRAGGIA